MRGRCVDVDVCSVCAVRECHPKCLVLPSHCISRTANASMRLLTWYCELVLFYVYYLPVIMASKYHKMSREGESSGKRQKRVISLSEKVNALNLWR